MIDHEFDQEITISDIADRCELSVPICMTYLNGILTPPPIIPFSSDACGMLAGCYQIKDKAFKKLLLRVAMNRSARFAAPLGVSNT